MRTLYKIFSLLLVLSSITVFAAPRSREYYVIRIYTINGSDQAAMVDEYLKSAYLPAAHRAGIKNVGVFKPIESDTAAFGKKIVVLVPLPSWAAVESLEETLARDQVFQKSSEKYWGASYDHAPYVRMETIVTKAFTDMPKMQVPLLKGPMLDRIYELRSYESPTERIFANKVKMFNEGDEIGLFKRLGFNAVFYSEVIAGGKMPNLMYMTSFDNRAERDAHWKTFVDDAQWKTLSTAAEYQHNVSKIDIYLLHPAEYSEI